MKHQPSNLPIRLAQTIGITTSTLLGGSILSLSTFLIPLLLKSPSPLLLRQWLHLHNRTMIFLRTLSLLAEASFFYLAFTLPKTAGRVRFYSYCVAGVLSACFAPYAFVVMRGVEGKLKGMVEGEEEVGSLGRGIGDMEEVKVHSTEGEENAHVLVDWWGVLNLGRGVMVTAAGVLGAWTALGYEV